MNNDGDIREVVVREQYWDGEWNTLARKLPATEGERYKHLHSAVENLIARMGRAENRLDDIQSECANPEEVPVVSVSVSVRHLMAVESLAKAVINDPSAVNLAALAKLLEE